MRVLIVDDQLQARQGMKALLGAWYKDMEIREAANGCQALQQVDDFQPEVVLMDIKMQKMNGIEALRQIKAKWQQIKVILFSTDPDYAAEALAAGADAFICKTDTPERLRGVLWNVSQGTQRRS